MAQPILNADDFLNADGVRKMKDFINKKDAESLQQAQTYTDNQLDSLISEETMAAFEAIGWVRPSGKE